MLRVTSMTRYQAFRWLWRFDSEARYFWLKYFLLGHNLKEDVIINLSDFGVVKRVCFIEIKRLKLQLSNQLEF